MERNHAGYFENNNTVMPGQMDYSQVSGQVGKRRRVEESSMQEGDNAGMSLFGKHFLPIRKNCGVYYTQEWKSTGTSLYCPVTSDMFVNIHKYDHFTSEEGNFFVADETGNYSKSVHGYAVNMWKHNKDKLQFYVAQSFLFTNSQDFHIVQTILLSS